MNRQVGYIAYAHVILATAVLGCVFISKIPLDSFEQIDNVGQCGTVSPEKNTSLSKTRYNGKALFQSKCASCHNVLKDMTGPALSGFQERGPWADRKNLYQWIRNPEGFMKNDAYTRQLKKQYGSVMTAFSNITDDEVDAIVEYIQ